MATLPDIASMDIQAEIQWFMRPYLLDFLIEAHNAFGLLPETLFLAINLLDRYCSKRVVYKKHYQLVGCAALLIGSKYGDRKERVPVIRELKNMCGSQYDEDMFTQMEWHVLQTLGWVIGHPTIDSFLQIAFDGANYDSEIEHMACYISEIALYHREFVAKRPSDMARASLTLARCILNRPQPDQSEWAAKCDPQTLISLSQQLHRPTAIVSRKYASSHLSQVSIILESFLARQASISRYYEMPPTPPRQTSMTSAEKAVPANPALLTPQKGQHLNHGYLTPPITPELEYFAGYNPGLMARRSPGSPTPLRSQPMTHPDLYY